MDIKKGLKKFWFIVWKDDSFKGWILSLLFIFIFIKFIFFPGLSFITGTQLPLAIVESCSMYHQGNLLSNNAEWWERQNSKYNRLAINNLDFEKFPMKNGLTKGDVIFVVKVNPDKLKQGDVIIFNADNSNIPHPVIHRIVDIHETPSGRIFSTMGDNVGHVQGFEEEITENQIMGKAILRLVPYLGWGKLIFFEEEINPFEWEYCSEN